MTESDVDPMEGGGESGDSQPASRGDSLTPREVLQEEAPLSRESLCDERVVAALWHAADDAAVSQSAFGVAEVYRSFEHSTVCQYEIRTALDWFGHINYKRTSLGFENEIARQQHD